MALPLGIGLSIFVGDVHHWKLAKVVDAGMGSCWLPPVSAWNVLPPLARIIAMSELGGHLKDHGARLAHVFWQGGDQLRADRTLGHGDIACGFHKGCKL